MTKRTADECLLSSQNTKYEYISNSSKNAIIGYWQVSKDDVDLLHQFPIENEEKYPDEFIKKLKEWELFLIQLHEESFTKTNYFDSRTYGGVSFCRLCEIPNGNLEIDYNGFTFPEGLIHYLIFHSIKLDQKFIDMINNYCVPYHLLHDPKKFQKTALNIITKQNLSHNAVQYSDYMADYSDEPSDECDYYANDFSDSSDFSE